MAEPIRHRITVAEYERMDDESDTRTELLEGEIIDMVPPGNRHAATVDRLNLIFVWAVSEQAIVRVQSPIQLDIFSEPEPDLSILKPQADFYASRRPRPADVLLLLEVADSSTRYDRTRKRPMYAAAEIPEMWIVDLQEDVVEVATSPLKRSYQNISRFMRDEEISPLALPELMIRVSDIL